MDWNNFSYVNHALKVNIQCGNQISMPKSSFMKYLVELVPFFEGIESGLTLRQVSTCFYAGTSGPKMTHLGQCTYLRHTDWRDGGEIVLPRLYFLRAKEGYKGPLLVFLRVVYFKRGRLSQTCPHLHNNTIWIYLRRINQRSSQAYCIYTQRTYFNKTSNQTFPVLHCFSLNEY